MMPPNDNKGKESKPKHDLEEVSQDVASELPGAEDVDAAFENMTAGDMEQKPADKLGIEGVETKFAMKPDAHATKESLNVVESLMKGGAKDLAGLKERFLQNVRESDPTMDEKTALAMLDQALEQQHEVYFDLGKAELASEIDAFRRSLDTSLEAKTEVGKDYVARLNAGEFKSLDEAISALDVVAKSPMSPAEKASLNAEFNALFAAAQERFSTSGSAEAGGLEDVTEGEIDDLFGGLEAGTETKAKTGLEDVTDKDVDDLFDNIQKTGT